MRSIHDQTAHITVYNLFLEEYMMLFQNCGIISTIEGHAYRIMEKMDVKISVGLVIML
jgi:hypothetical protein